MSTFKFCLQVLRPKQWLKNLLLLAAPIASARLYDYFFIVLIGVVTFVGASSLGYLVNDWIDRDFDKLSEKKRARPFASGKLGKNHYKILLLITFLITASGAIFLGQKFSIAIFVYLILTLFYSLKIKLMPIIEMVWLASGFLVRAVAGSILVETTPTGWFNITVFFGALFVVSTKRMSEKKYNKGTITRKVLEYYDEEVLSSIVNVSAASTILTFCLWVIQEHPESYFAQLSILPFVSTVLLYKFKSSSSLGETPEDIFISNKDIILVALISCVLLGIVFYQ